MDADRSCSAQDVWCDGTRARRERIAQDDVRVIRELVELATTRDRTGLQAVLCPGATDPQPDAGEDPIAGVERACAAEAPVRGAEIVQIGGTG